MKIVDIRKNFVSISRGSSYDTVVFELYKRNQKGNLVRWIPDGSMQHFTYRRGDVDEFDLVSV